MEGGKVMKSKLIFRIVFVTLLAVILLGLIFIIFDKTGSGAHIFDQGVLNDYKISDETVDCDGIKKLIYSDKKYDYYLECSNSKIFIIWDDGARDSLDFDLNINKLSMSSLEAHGLKVIKDERKN
jgi:hypothetical protein